MAYHPVLMLRIARDFVTAADHCMKPINEQPGGNPADSLRVVPAITNAAVAAELALKAALATLKRQVPRDDHSLVNLYGRLPESLQVSIKERLRARMEGRNVTDADFSQGLQKVARVFVKWRYIYEHAEVEPLDYKFLAEFAAAACEVVSVLLAKTVSSP